MHPAIARETDIQGKVYVKFVVTKTGKVDKIQILRGVGNKSDKKAQTIYACTTKRLKCKRMLHRAYKGCIR